MLKIILFVILCFSGNAFTAEQFVYKNRLNRLICFIGGPITRDDPIILEKNIAMGCTGVDVSSPGGEVDAALKMGKAIRKAQMDLVISDIGRCASSCVFLYAGAVIRTPYAPIEIHRPYFGASTDSFELTNKKYNLIEQKIKIYLREMNVSDSLFELMMSTPPERTQKLNLEELEKLGLGLTDPVYEEYMENKSAARAGITKQEWLRKKSYARQKCGDNKIMTAAEAKIILPCWEMYFQEYFSHKPESNPGMLEKTSIKPKTENLAPPVPTFESTESRLAYLAWLNKISEKLKYKIPDQITRRELLQTIFFECNRSGISPNVVLGIIDVMSNFNKSFVDTNLRGYMAVGITWASKLGFDDSSIILGTQRNLRLGSVILKNYLEQRDGNTYEALLDYLAGNLELERTDHKVLQLAQSINAKFSVW